jgi:hypothetical protein
VPATQPVVGLAPPVPGPQCSIPSQTLPSSHRVSIGVLRQPCRGTHVSTVHENPSSGQTSGVPNLQPLTGSHVSVPLQGFESLQSEFVATCLQASALSSHESTVQSTPSSQVTGDPPWQMPLTHVSTPVQNKPSLHCVDVVHALPGTHPFVGSQTCPVGHAA